MNENDCDTQTSPRPRAAPAGVESDQTAPSDCQRVWRDEILALAQNGENPARLRKLVVAWDANQLRRIRELIGPERERELSHLLELKNSRLDILGASQLASHRRDLTFPERIFLAKLARTSRNLLLGSLLIEGEENEPKRQSGTRSQR